jgi:serine/threonine-protein kinase HipA
MEPFRPAVDHRHDRRGGLTLDLVVLLADTRVGVIRTVPDGRIEFRFSSEYLSSARRPVLGQYFEDHLNEVQRSRVRLPPFFSNLLPEGGLRELLAHKAGVAVDREPELLSLLGEDLPGAIVVRASSEDAAGSDGQIAGSDEGEAEGPLRFSLAGAQLKFSVLYRDQGTGPTVPLDGRGGDWIAKLPSETYEGVPENEYAMMNWASRVGIAVPESALVKAGSIEGMPVQVNPERYVYLSRRFDRPPGGGRIHQEDFAQVVNVRPSRRYTTLSYASIARIVRSVGGEEDFDEVVRRIAFNILIGNGDAHLKNWSLTYPDRIQARLAPAYDLVATIAYIPEDKLGLRLSRENRFYSIGVEHFERLADKTGVNASRVTRIARETIQAGMANWPGDLDDRQDRLLQNHVRQLRLLKEAG